MTSFWENKYLSAERSIQFIQEAHNELLKGLHGEIETLQKQCSEYAYRLSLQASTAQEREQLDMEFKSFNTDYKKRDMLIAEQKALIDERNKTIKGLRERVKELERQVEHNALVHAKQVRDLNAKCDAQAKQIAQLTLHAHQHHNRSSMPPMPMNSSPLSIGELAQHASSTNVVHSSTLASGGGAGFKLNSKLAAARSIANLPHVDETSVGGENNAGAPRETHHRAIRVKKLSKARSLKKLNNNNNNNDNANMTSTSVAAASANPGASNPTVTLNDNERLAATDSSIFFAPDSHHSHHSHPPLPYQLNQLHHHPQQHPPLQQQQQQQHQHQHVSTSLNDFRSRVNRSDSAQSANNLSTRSERSLSPLVVASTAPSGLMLPPVVVKNSWGEHVVPPPDPKPFLQSAASTLHTRSRHIANLTITTATASTATNLATSATNSSNLMGNSNSNSNGNTSSTNNSGNNLIQRRTLISLPPIKPFAGTEFNQLAVELPHKIASSSMLNLQAGANDNSCSNNST